MHQNVGPIESTMEEKSTTIRNQSSIYSNIIVASGRKDQSLNSTSRTKTFSNNLSTLKKDNSASILMSYISNLDKQKTTLTHECLSPILKNSKSRSIIKIPTIYENAIPFIERKAIRKFTNQSENLISIDENIQNKVKNKKLKFLINKSPYDILPKNIKYNQTITVDKILNNNIKKKSVISIFPSLKNSFLTNSKNYIKSVNNGSSSIYFKPKIENQNLFKKIILSKENTSNYFKKASKLKLLKQINMNCPLIIESLLKYFKEILVFSKKYNYKINKKMFIELIGLIQIKKDEYFLENLFLIFGDQTRFIDIKEMFIGFELFRMDSYENKINIILDLLCFSIDHEQYVNLNEVLFYLKLFAFTNRDCKKLNDLIKILFNEYYINDENKLNLEKNNVYNALINNEEMKKLLMQSFSDNLNDIDNFFDEEMKSITLTNLKKSQ